MIGAVDRTLDVAQQGVHPPQAGCLTAALAASCYLRLVDAASRLHAPETRQPVRAYQRARLQMLRGPSLQRPLAEARQRAQPQPLRTPLGTHLGRGHKGRLALGATPPLASSPR